MAKDLMKVIDLMGTAKFGILFIVLSILVGMLSGMLGLGEYLAAPMTELKLATIVGLLVVIVLTKVAEEKLPI